MKHLLLLIFLLTHLSMFAQVQLAGTVVDSKNDLPLEFVNVGVVMRGIGTVTGEDGNFTLRIPDAVMDDSIRFSMLGYKPENFKVSDLLSIQGNQQVRIHLQQQPLELKEVTVHSRKRLRIKVLGNRSTSMNTIAGFVTNDLGSEIAIKIKVKDTPAQVKQFSFNIAHNLYDSVMFRFNIYSVDEQGFPGENILRENVIIQPSEKTGLITVDLSDQNIFLFDDAFIAIEWIRDYGSTTGLMFSTGLFGSGTYFRKASQDQWSQLSIVGVGLNVTVEY